MFRDALLGLLFLFAKYLLSSVISYFQRIVKSCKHSIIKFLTSQGLGYVPNCLVDIVCDIAWFLHQAI
jgi:hypothetical protein